MKKIISEGDCLDTLDVVGGQERRVDILAGEDFSFALAPEEHPRPCFPAPVFSMHRWQKGRLWGSPMFWWRERLSEK